MKATLITSTIAALSLAGALAAPTLAWGGQRPDGFHAGDASGVYIWHRAGVDHGWHLETTDPKTGGVHTYSGTLSTNGKFTDVNLIKAEKDDSASIDGNGNLNFSFVTASGIDGMDFRDPGGTQITFNLSIDGQPMPVSEIDLGDNSHHPATNPFTLKEPADDGRPDGFDAGDGSGVYLWHRAGVDHGWHLETTDPAKTGDHTYTGTVTTDGKFVDLQLVRAEKDDSASIDGNGNLNFSFQTYSGIDGMDWRVDGGTQMTFTLYEDGQLMSTSSINVGDASNHPASDPFSIGA